VFGDRLDGTYLGIDSTHAHINMPAAILWARGLDDRPATLTLVPPRSTWRAATQLYAGTLPNEFTAPNLQYLMDSPVELGPLVLKDVAVGGRTIRLALHHAGDNQPVDGLAADVAKIVREAVEVFGEQPAYESGRYTFLVDYLPWASPDAMEHRNSTVITAPASIGSSRPTLLDSVAHEFFHVWNVERIRPRSLEPFDFERANMSGELWLAEGFTQYYGSLLLSRAGLLDLSSTVSTLGGLVTTVVLSPARGVRSAEEMSRMAVFTDAGPIQDPTNWSNTYISYYPFGGAIALALDLTLRERSAGRLSLDDYMRAMWQAHGKSPGARPGYVERPYTMADAEARLAEVDGDPGFARQFFARHIQGRDLPEYGRLLAQAGLVLRKTDPGRAWWGNLSLEGRGAGVRIAAPTAFDAPAHAAGLDLDDELRQIDGQRVGSAEDVYGILRKRQPGSRIAVTYVDRGGVEKRTVVTLAGDPHVEVVPAESTGTRPTPAQQAFRARWLN
jgi:predicted metalloprotease with PDZ domain